MLINLEERDASIARHFTSSDEHQQQPQPHADNNISPKNHIKHKLTASPVYTKRSQAINRYDTVEIDTRCLCSHEHTHPN